MKWFAYSFEALICFICSFARYLFFVFQISLDSVLIHVNEVRISHIGLLSICRPVRPSLNKKKNTQFRESLTFIYFYNPKVSFPLQIRMILLRSVFEIINLSQHVTCNSL